MEKILRKTFLSYCLNIEFLMHEKIHRNLLLHFMDLILSWKLARKQVLKKTPNHWS